MQNSPSDVHASLSTKLGGLVTAQKKLAWTTPSLSAKLDESVKAVAGIGATLKLSAKASAGASAGAGAGVKTDALSLGVGVSAGAAAKISAGVSLGVGFSASASIGAALTANLHGAISLVASLERELALLNKASAAVAGTGGVLPPGRGVNNDGVDSAIRNLGSKLSDSQSQATAQAPPTEKSPLTGELRMTRMGPWQADVVTDDEVAIGGKISVKIDALAFVGTVVPDKSGLDGSRARCRVVGGNGGLAKEISGKSYTASVGVKVGAVLRDILHDCGEDLSDLADGPTLERHLTRWHVAGGTAHDALKDLAESVQCSYRVLRDGKVWLGPETWPEVKPDHQLLEENHSAGSFTLAPETPDMVPGVVYQGRRIEHVVHTFGEDLRTIVRVTHPAAVLDKALAGTHRKIDYSREYPCKVVTQNPDGTLQLLPDDEVMKARGLDHVPIRYGLPGFKAVIKSGARCHLAFAAGDPSRPFAHNWEFDADAVDSVEFVTAGRSAPVCRQGDSLKVFFVPGVPIPVSGVLTPPGTAFTGFITIATPLLGVVQTGNPKFRA